MRLQFQNICWFTQFTLTGNVPSLCTVGGEFLDINHEESHPGPEAMFHQLFPITKEPFLRLDYICYVKKKTF